MKIKNTIKAVMCICAAAFMFVTGFADEPAQVADVYNFKATIKLPLTNKGVRAYKACTYKGIVTVTYDDAGEMTSVTTEAVSKTGPELTFDATEFFAVRMGKNLLATSSLYFEGEAPEAFERIAFSGYGKMAKFKQVSDGCGPCGTATTTYCYKMSAISGNITGMYNCICGDSAPSVKIEACNEAIACGPCEQVEGTPVAPLCGSFSMTLNKKLSNLK